MSVHNFILFQGYLPPDCNREIAAILRTEVPPFAKALDGDRDAVRENYLDTFFGQVSAVTGQKVKRGDGDGVGKYLTELVTKRWKNLAQEKKGRSAEMLVASYYYFHTVPSGKAIAERIDRAIFGEKTFEENFGEKVPGCEGSDSDTSHLPENFAIVPKPWGNIAPIVGGRPSMAPIRLVHGDGIRRADFSPCGRYVVASGAKGSSGARAWLWKIDGIANGDEPQEIAFHEEDIYGSIFTQDGQKIIAAAGEIASVWLSTGHSSLLHKLRHEGDVSHIARSNDGKLIATAAWDKQVRIWDAVSFKLLRGFPVKLRRKHFVNCANFSPDGSHLAIACTNGDSSIWDVAECTKLRDLEDFDSEGACSATYSSDGSMILVSTWAGTAGLFDAGTGKLIRELGEDEPHDDAVYSAEFSSDQKWALTASDDRAAIIWDVESGKALVKMPHPDALYSGYFSPDDRHVLTACDDGCAYLWRVA